MDIVRSLLCFPKMLMILINNYFGIYNDLVTVFIYDKYSGYADVILNQTIGGIKFTYNNSNEIIVWKQI